MNRHQPQMLPGLPFSGCKPARLSLDVFYRSVPRYLPAATTPLTLEDGAPLVIMKWESRSPLGHRADAAGKHSWHGSLLWGCRCCPSARQNGRKASPIFDFWCGATPIRVHSALRSLIRLNQCGIADPEPRQSLVQALVCNHISSPSASTSASSTCISFLPSILLSPGPFPVFRKGNSQFPTTFAQNPQSVGQSSSAFWASASLPPHHFTLHTSHTHTIPITHHPPLYPSIHPSITQTKHFLLPVFLFNRSTRRVSLYTCPPTLPCPDRLTNSAFSSSHTHTHITRCLRRLPACLPVHPALRFQPRHTTPHQHQPNHSTSSG